MFLVGLVTDLQIAMCMKIQLPRNLLPIFYLQVAETHEMNVFLFLLISSASL